jgi:hypothetical protein
VSEPDILPDSRLRDPSKGLVFKGSQAWQPVFCANCGKDGGWTPTTSTYMFYLCDNCVDTHGVPAGTMVIPDQVFWQKCREAQMNEFGRELTPIELLQTVEEGASPLARLLTLGR